jgi:uncharacterized protein (DUF342 family)
VGKITNASCRVTLAADRMSALLDIVPAQGGRRVTLGDARNAAMAARVVFGLDEAALAGAVAQGQADAVVIARGRAPKPGTPVVFHCLLDNLRHKPPADTARVDCRRLGSLLIVSPGDALMRREPPRQGTPGADVLGQVLSVPVIPNVGYALGLKGVTFDERDPNLLRAAVAGAPVEVRHGVNVSAVVETGDVDLSTGNIEFDGALQVRGDIKNGMVVRVTGEVLVQGVLEAADLQAGGDVTALGGIIGAPETPDLAPGAEPRFVRVVSQGTVRSRFINNAFVSASGDVAVEVEIVNSEVLAGGAIDVGGAGARRGGIVGGRSRALKRVQAPSLGAPGGVATHVQAGLDPHADSRRAQLEALREGLREEQHKLEQILEFLKHHPAKAEGGLDERTRNTYVWVRDEVMALDAEIAELAKDITRIEDVFIEASHRLCNGVILQIGNRRTKVLDNFGRIRAVWQDGNIVLR